MTQRLRLRAVGLFVLVPALITTAVAWHAGLLQTGPTQRPQNSLLIIAPYIYQGTWVNDAVERCDARMLVRGRNEIFFKLVCVRVRVALIACSWRES